MNQDTNNAPAAPGPVDRPVGHPVWENGFAANLAAAAEDADKWMELIERLHNDGAGPWKFSQRDSLAKLRACRRILRGFLSPNVKVTGAAPEKG